MKRWVGLGVIAVFADVSGSSVSTLIACTTSSTTARKSRVVCLTA